MAKIRINNYHGAANRRLNMEYGDLNLNDSTVNFFLRQNVIPFKAVFNTLSNFLYVKII